MFLKDLECYGPQAKVVKPPTLGESQWYCRRLARRHYENFTVVGRLVPKELRQHVANIYAYCRWADDLADEIDDAQRSLALLDWWEQGLCDCFGGKAVHPVYVALGETIREFKIPVEPFLDLLWAFRRDQQVTRYGTIEQLLEYCHHSADPVGRLVLYLGRCHTPERVRYSNAICTGLQLANFWQDVARDWQHGRIYIPQSSCLKFGYNEGMFERREYNEAFRQMLAYHVAQTEARLKAGIPLAALMPKGLQLSVALFVQGGLAILKAIRRQNYDVWSRRPTVSRFEKFRLLIGCWWKRPS